MLRRAHSVHPITAVQSENAGALGITLTEDDLAVLDPLADQVVGSRY